MGASILQEKSNRDVSQREGHHLSHQERASNSLGKKWQRKKRVKCEEWSGVKSLSKQVGNPESMHTTSLYHLDSAVSDVSLLVC